MADDRDTTHTMMVLMFTDIVGSVDLKHQIGGEAYNALIKRHDAMFSEVVGATSRAKILKDTGDGFLASFGTVSEAVGAALRFQHAMHHEPWQPVALFTRIGIHLGEVAEISSPDTQTPKIVGLAADMTARLMNLAQGGQILLTRAAYENARQFVRSHPRMGGTIPDPELEWRAHGRYQFKGADAPMDVFEVGARGIAPLTPPEDSEKAKRVGDLAQHDTLTQLGKYPIRRWLGNGGMGSVYLGDHPELKVRIAIKTIRSDLATDDKFVRQFLQEAQVAARLNHSNIVRVYDAGQSQGRCYIVQEYVEGGDLRQRLDSLPNKRLTTPLAVKIALGVATALVVAEKEKIVHRDIKPQNILLGPDDTPKLADLGLAKHYRSAEGTGSTVLVTESELCGGSPPYMAPEQIMNAKNVDTRADIYALGITLYELVTGQVPFGDLPVAEMLKRRLHENVPDPRVLSPGIPARLAAVICRMTQQDPAKRYQTAQELVAALQGCAEPARRRIPTLYLLGAAAVVVLGVAVAALLLPRTPHDSVALLAAEKCLLADQPEKALSLVEQALARDPGNTKALYAQGLCYVLLRQEDKLAGVMTKLKGGQDGEELSQQLTAEQQLQNGDTAAAGTTASSWLDRAKFRLAFYFTKGMATAGQDQQEAMRLLQRALQEKPLLEVQRYLVADALAKLYVAQGQPEKAVALYQSLNPAGTVALAGLGTPLLGNYAYTLFQQGQTKEAGDVLGQVLREQPDDTMGLYLKQKLADQQSQGASERMARVMTMIDNISKSVKQQAAADDSWTGQPVVITLLSPAAAVGVSQRLGEDRMWLDTLVSDLQEKAPFPVVDRETLEQLLREHGLSASKLSAPEARLKIGTLLPASVLVEPSVICDRGKATLKLRLVDVATAEIIGLVSRELATTNAQTAKKGLEDLAADLLAKIESNFRLRGRVVAVKADVCELNIGRYHGVKPGQLLDVYAPLEEQPTVAKVQQQQPVATLKIQTCDKYTATAAAASDAALKAGMLVLGPPPGK